MFTSQLVKNNVGQHYIISLRNFSSQTKSIKAEKFNNVNASLQFLHTLRVPHGIWQSIAVANTFFSYQSWKIHHPHSTIEHYIAESLVQGWVQVYASSNLYSIKPSASKASFSDEFGTGFQLQPAAALLLNNKADTKILNSESDAKALIKKFDADDSALAEILSDNNIAINKSPSETMVAALMSGELVVTIHPSATKPSVTTEYVEEVVNNAQPEPAPQAKETSTQQSQRDDDASAAVLQQAAEDGTPFCEECEKANQEKAA